MKENTEKTFDIVVYFTNGNIRQPFEASVIDIRNDCLIIVDPENESPREVRCYPLSQIKRFEFDYDAVREGKTNLYI